MNDRWKKFKQRLHTANNEKGSVLLVSVLILSLATIIGIAISNTSSVEILISGNDRAYKENFYLAEGAAMMLAQILENAPGHDPNVVMPVDADHDTITEDTITEDTYWEGGKDKSQPAPGLAPDNQPQYIAKSEGLARGSSLDMSGGTRMYEYTIFGRRKKSNSTVVIEMGYRKRF
jgi:Tfp pilus assembly protein PilX